MKTEMLGPDAKAGEVQEIRFLNWILAWHEQGISWEADPRHAEMVAKQLWFRGLIVSGDTGNQGGDEDHGEGLARAQGRGGHA